ncbi:MAG: hypothetical protein LHV69_09850 [Elusimicrobia bacterium]|nr:hypothetical protein [Candidatus Obscuribacterium magneticum]
MATKNGINKNFLIDQHNLPSPIKAVKQISRILSLMQGIEEGNGPWQAIPA